MKKITKQFICVLLIFTVCLFTACGNDGAKDQSEITDGGITFDPEGLVDWEYTVKTDDLLTSLLSKILSTSAVVCWIMAIYLFTNTATALVLSTTMM